MFRHTTTLLSKHVNSTTSAPVTGIISKPSRKIAATASFHPSQLLRYIYEPHPGPLNCTTLFPTRDFASEPAHPFYIKTQRKLEAFDKEKLHFRVQCPVDLSKRAFVRSWAVKRVSKALRQSIGETATTRRSDDAGDALLEGMGAGAGEDENRGAKLMGALLIILSKDKIALTATDAEVRQSVNWLLQRVREKRSEGLGRARRQKEKGRPDHVVKEAPRSQGRKAGIHGKPLVAASTVTVGESMKRKGTSLPPDPETCRKQLEFYFSDANMAGDRHMLHLTGGHENKTVPLERLLKFKRMKVYREDVGFVVTALRGSEELEVIRMGEGKKGGNDGRDEMAEGKDWGARRRVAYFPAS